MVSIDRVYQKVLALANKEQRGYITPQEFNLFADHAQMEIFEQYFYDINQFIRLPGNNTGHSDVVTNIEEKISIFERYDQNVRVEGGLGNVMMSEIDNLYRLEMVRVDYVANSVFVVAEEVQLNELNKYGTAPLATWSKKRPVYTRYKGSTNPQALKVYPNPEDAVWDADNQEYIFTDRVLISYIQKPLKPNWSYVVVNDKPLYNATSAVDFELHGSEEIELVYRILALAGVAIEKPQLTQVAAGLQGAQIQQEKQ
jgi:hypothetical protein